MTLKTGLLYSERYQNHNTGPDHPERPARVTYIFQFLQKSDLFQKLYLLDPKPVELDVISLVHTISYINRVKEACLSGEHFLDSPDTAICPESFEIALLAAGGVLTLVDAVMEKKVRNGFALIRPPGHHAEREMALGFCIFNHVAIAARHLQKKYGLKRILIVDWDVHHGNGTQHIFEEDPSVFYFSVHQYPFYPGTGSVSEMGRGKGEGTTLNVPFPAGSGDKEYKQTFVEIFYPEALRFKPDFILISAGFDAHEADPLAQMKLTDESYGFFTDVIKKLARQCKHERIASVFEGGYDLEAMSRSVYVHLKHLMI